MSIYLGYRKHFDTYDNEPVIYVIDDGERHVTLDDIVHAEITLTHKGLPVSLIGDCHEYVMFENTSTGRHLADKLCDMLNMVIETRIDIASMGDHS